MNVQDRFLKYVSYWTTSEDDIDMVPSTLRQFDLAKELVEEMTALGIQNVVCDDHCYVYGYLPATEGYENKKSIGLIAHMDTAPAYCGENVKPQIIENYDGKDIILSATGDMIKVSDFPLLPSRKGETLIVTDGTTLLGADDKAGIAEILTAVDIINKERIPHGEIWIGFTPDEEVGMGASMFDLDIFQADYGYTVDGGYEGEISFENFNAASAEFILKGVNVHPGSAKNIMINAATVACEIQSMLPEKETPEHTESREGFYHLVGMSGDVNKARLVYIIRDHDKELFKKRQDYLTEVAEKIAKKYGPNVVTLNLQHSYSNMLEIMEEHFYVVEKAKEAIKKIGLTPVSEPVRGGTDGAQLSFKGLPCPNLGTGGDGFHGPMEHISVDAMERAVKVLIEILKNPVDK